MGLVEVGDDLGQHGLTLHWVRDRGGPRGQVRAAEREAGQARIEDLDLATTQFLGMVSNYVFWPALLLPGWDVSAARAAEVVDEAVRTLTARYAVSGPGASTGG